MDHNLILSCLILYCHILSYPPIITINAPTFPSANPAAVAGAAEAAEAEGIGKESALAVPPSPAEKEAAPLVAAAELAALHKCHTQCQTGSSGVTQVSHQRCRIRLKRCSTNVTPAVSDRQQWCHTSVTQVSHQRCRIGLYGVTQVSHTVSDRQ
jgi:hypothetical protein